MRRPNPIGATALLLLAAAGARGQESPRPWTRAPDFELASGEGSTIRLSSLRGSIVVLYFFRHGCAPCRQSHPALRQLLREPTERNIRLVAVDVDGIRRPSPRPDAQRLQRDLGRAFPIATADDRVLSLYGQVLRRSQIPGTPTFFILDREGFVYSHHSGALDEPTLMASIEFLYGVDQYRTDE